MIRNIMLIDDNELDNFVHESLISEQKLAEILQVYGSAASAMDVLKNIQKNFGRLQNLIPGLILVDLNMPIMDGFQFLDELKSLDPRLRKKLKVVILTTSMNPMDSLRTEKYPFVIGFLHKPLIISELLDIYEKIYRGQPEISIRNKNSLLNISSLDEPSTLN